MAAAVVDRSLFVKISMAGIKGALDLSEMDLEEIPAEVFEIQDLKVCLNFEWHLSRYERSQVLQTEA